MINSALEPLNCTVFDALNMSENVIPTRLLQIYIFYTLDIFVLKIV